jgi:VWFA-related protein
MRMTTRLTTIAVLILALLAAGVLPAAAQGPVNVTVDDLNLDNFPDSQVKVTVRDANGVPIPGLGVDRFELVEDGRNSFPPSEVTQQVNPDAAISVVMVIDISGSMEGKPIDEAMRAANALLDQLSPQDRAAIIAFADEVQDLDPTKLEEGKEVGFTTDKNAIRNIVNFLDTKIGWDTPLYDAIYKGVKMASSEPAGKRAVVVMTDGRDERDNAQGVPVKDAGSLSTPDDPINEANRYNIPIFSVGLGSKLDTKYLARLAERTGGVYQQAPQPEELTPLFENVISQLKTQYQLDYQSRLPDDGNYHSMMVRVVLPQGQDFDEIKFQVGDPDSAEPPPPPSAGEEPGSVTVNPTAEPADSEVASLPESESAASPGAQETPEPESTGLQGIIDTVRDTIDEQPTLAIVIGAGALLLLILLIVLIVVLMRGRRQKEEEYAPVDFGETFSAPSPAWGAEETDMGRTGPGTDFDTGDRTEMAPGGGWGEAPAAAPPFGPPPGPAPQPPRDAEIPAAGGTKIIERAPKHMAMLVDKKNPDRKYDLKGTVNVGRAHENQLVLDHATISRHHAWIKPEEGEFLIFDVGSANGTFVNGEKVEEPRHLQSGDVVRFGDAEFIFTKVF